MYSFALLTVIAIAQNSEFHRNYERRFPRFRRAAFRGIISATKLASFCPGLAARSDREKAERRAGGGREVRRSGVIPRDEYDVNK